MEEDFLGKQIESYRLVEEINLGGFARVYKAEHIVFKNEPIVAIKLIRALSHSQEEYKQFLQEAQTQRLLKHPYILPLLGAGIYKDFYYLIVEYAPNRSLHDRLQSRASKPLSLGEAITILKHIGSALQFAHQMDIVHRDLKPHNILFNAKEEALLADFGIAVVLEKTNRVDTTGSPPYMAPEQFDGIVSKRSDQYALGCIAYELVTGRRPFILPPDANWWSWANKHRTENPTAPTQLNPHLPIHVEQTILKAMAKDRDNRYKSVDQFIEALQASPEQWLAEGDICFKAGRYEDALSHYEHAIQLYPNHAAAYCSKGNVLRALKRYEEALAEYERSLQRDPNSAAAYYGKGNTLVSRHRSAEALMAYERALQLGFSKALVHCGKGEVFCALLSYHEALASYEWALLCEPNCAPAYRGKGHALYGLKCYEEALAAYKQALQRDPDDVAAYRGKLNALRDLNQYEEALKICEQIIQLDREDVQAYVSKGEVLYLLKRYKDALAVCEKALQLDGNSTSASRTKYHTLILLERYEEASRFYETDRTRIYPRKYVYADTRCFQTLVTAKEALLHDPRDAHAYTDKADALSSLDLYEEALVAYEQAIQLDPGYVPAFYGMGRALRHLECYEKALNAYEQVIRLEPNHHSIYQDKGNILEQLGRLAEARQAHLKHFELNPPIQYHRSRL